MAKFQLHGGMIPRTVRRIFDQRSEERIEMGEEAAVLTLRGRSHVVEIVNVSRSGAMIAFNGTPHIGESVSLQMLDRGVIQGQVRWVRDGRIGISFARALEL